ncbi:hypothetical protein [Streptomyces sp. V1I1]|uniref:hypothetical protein n=1 Tax=Streptomyces sp. V1I1 TaxID=3042272 RepID=UPI0027846A72|nr:hypothetical protein [Streptomyces sp. V1I1]MDQ0945994.1 hypothetical protein [Streptomyces sp. V1I1]
MQFSDYPFSAAALAMPILWAFRTGPGWLTSANEWTLLAYGVLLYGANHIVNNITETSNDLIDPDRWDGDVAYEMAKDLAQLRADIDLGADIDDVLDSLRSSGLIPELAATTSALTDRYAARGDQEESWKLRTAEQYLRTADQTIGYHNALDALEAGGTCRPHPQ